MAAAGPLPEAAFGSAPLYEHAVIKTLRDVEVNGLQVISLGVHVIDHEFLEAVLLMEVMPTMLARRVFPHPRTLEQLEPGFRDSPDPHHDMAIVFVKARDRMHAQSRAAPSAVVACEKTL